jgi:hypothetical protein
MGGSLVPRKFSKLQLYLISAHVAFSADSIFANRSVSDSRADVLGFVLRPAARARAAEAPGAGGALVLELQTPGAARRSVGKYRRKHFIYKAGARACLGSNL